MEERENRTNDNDGYALEEIDGVRELANEAIFVGCLKKEK
jgi:hypothetical protein